MTREDAEAMADRENEKRRPGVRYEVGETEATQLALDEAPPPFGGFYVWLRRLPAADR